MLKLLSTSITLLVIFGLGCVDAREPFDDFAGRIIDAGAGNQTDAAPLEEIPDITGTFLMGMSAVTAPDRIAQFAAETTYTDNGDGTGTVSIALQPLHTATREPVGDPVVMDGSMAPVANTGEFSATFEGLLPADANPITGTNLRVRITMSATIKSVDLFCGPLDGDVIAPVPSSIDGSSFAAIRIDPDSAPADLPPVIGECPTDEPPEVDAGVPDPPLDAGGLDAGELDGGL